MKAMRKTDLIEATQWFKMGDHPRDKEIRCLKPGNWIIDAGEDGISVYSNETFEEEYVRV